MFLPPDIQHHQLQAYIAMDAEHCPQVYQYHPFHSAESKEHAAVLLHRLRLLTHHLPHDCQWPSQFHQ